MAGVDEQGNARAQEQDKAWMACLQRQEEWIVDL
jgi:hypothetical protein